MYSRQDTVLISIIEYFRHGAWDEDTVIMQSEGARYLTMRERIKNYFTFAKAKADTVRSYCSSEV